VAEVCVSCVLEVTQVQSHVHAPIPGRQYSLYGFSGRIEEVAPSSSSSLLLHHLLLFFFFFFFFDGLTELMK
jgi:hypothetical protein